MDTVRSYEAVVAGNALDRPSPEQRLPRGIQQGVLHLLQANLLEQLHRRQAEVIAAGFVDR